MPNCFKCGNEITFDKTILSKSGKQIPLWIDKQNTHSHDDNGQPIRSPLPSQQLQQNNYAAAAQIATQPPIVNIPKLSDEPTSRPSLEATLLNQTSQKTEEALKQLEAIKYFSESILATKIEQCFELAKNSNMMLEALVGHFKLTEPKKASELYQENQQEQQQPQTKEENKILNQEGI